MYYAVMIACSGHESTASSDQPPFRQAIAAESRLTGA
jgi:hypothetical protein